MEKLIETFSSIIADNEVLLYQFLGMATMATRAEDSKQAMIWLLQKWATQKIAEEARNGTTGNIFGIAITRQVVNSLSEKEWQNLAAHCLELLEKYKEKPQTNREDLVRKDVRLPIESIKRLEAFAGQNGLSTSDVINAALQQYLNR